MGAYFAARFYDAPDISTVLIARDQRLETLKKDGLVVNGKPYFIPAVNPEESDFTADLIIVALKHNHLAEGLQGLGNLVGPSTTFISVMNGLESEETIGAVYGMEKVLYAISLGIDAVRLGNQITFTKPGTHHFGEAKNLTISLKVRRVQQAFDQAGISHKTPEDMIRMLWWKFMVNVGINQASAVMRAPYSVFQSDPDAQGLMETLMQEVVILANALHVNLTRQDVQDWYPVLNLLSPQGKTSMLQDIEAKRKTEVDIFSGKVIQLGKTLAIPTPANQTIFQVIRVLEHDF
jgi:2-dehydropantoate 2-reductase